MAGRQSGKRSLNRPVLGSNGTVLEGVNRKTFASEGSIFGNWPNIEP